MVLDYVLEYAPSEQHQLEKVLRACFYLLQMMARGNPRVCIATFLIHYYFYGYIMIHDFCIIIGSERDF